MFFYNNDVICVIKNGAPYSEYILQIIILQKRFSFNLSVCVGVCESSVRCMSGAYCCCLTDEMPVHTALTLSSWRCKMQLLKQNKYTKIYETCENILETSMSALWHVLMWCCIKHLHIAMVPNYSVWISQGLWRSHINTECCNSLLVLSWSHNSCQFNKIDVYDRSWHFCLTVLRPQSNTVGVFFDLKAWLLCCDGQAVQ